VLELRPSGGSRVQTSTDVELYTNPPKTLMPYLMPDLRGKTPAQAQDLLDPYDVDEPSLTSRFHQAPDDNPNLDFGPGEITHQEPAPGQRTHVGTPPDTATVNPPTAPPVGGGGYSCGLHAPAVAFDPSPITDAQLGTKFPFALVTWLGDSTGGLAIGAERPNATFSVSGESQDLSFLSHFDGPIALLRLALSFLLWTGVAWFLYGRTIGKDT
jgi:hypothetical protein